MCQTDPIEIGGYCRPCKKLKSQWWREAHVPTEEQLVKIRARARAKMAVRRGTIEKKPCEVCGADAEMHHQDYSKPLEITWLCPEHHRQRHRHSIKTGPKYIRVKDLIAGSGSRHRKPDMDDGRPAGHVGGAQSSEPQSPGHRQKQ